LQRVCPEFGTFLVRNNFEEIILCGDEGKKFSINVFNSPDVNRIKMGRDWYDFCYASKLKVGDVVHFKFQLDFPTASKRCHVYKIK
jgi:hypothetical protein